MHFDLNKEVKAIQREARRFGIKEILPRVNEEEFKKDLVEKMGELGFFGCAFPERFGGTDLGFLAHSVVCEEISRIDSGLRSLFNLQAMTVPYTIMRLIIADDALGIKKANRKRLHTASEFK
jgi:glutaryl-CoA dehydrogenase (non-decarboxylating)